MRLKTLQLQNKAVSRQMACYKGTCYLLIRSARPQQLPLALRIGSGKFRTWLPSESPTSSGGRKERRQ
jgi:hypothetical protein